MPPSSHVYRFDRFVLDPGRRRLSRDGVDVVFPDACVRILACLVSKPGQIVSKRDLADAGWGAETTIGENSVDRAMSTIRTTIGEASIETVPRRGYRFAREFVVEESAVAPDPVEPLGPYRDVAEANGLIDTLECGAAIAAAEICRIVVAAQPAYAPAHVALATAYALIYESTRDNPEPDRKALRNALQHAREACRLDPSSAEAWSTLAFVLCLDGDAMDAIAAAQKAIDLDPRNWRHHLRLAYVSWGEARRLAAYQVIRLCPGLALAHWLVATVFIARGAFAEAIAELRIGCALQDAQSLESGRFNAVGLHLLLGLVLAALGLLEEALQEFDRELAASVPGQIYARECAANTWYSRGAVLLRLGRRDAAAISFRETLQLIHGHRLATIGLAVATGDVTGDSIPAVPAGDVITDADVVVATITALACQGRATDGARFAADILTSAEPGFTAWLLPVEPLINVAAAPECWRPALTILANRAR